MKQAITVTWLGHSCFAIEYQGYRVVLDPYQGVPGHADIDTEADLVLCSHSHGDHSHTAGVRLRSSGTQCPFKIFAEDCFHDEEWGGKRGVNAIHVLDCAGLRIAHFGDLGHALTPSALQRLGRCDLVLVPVGGHYTIDAAGAYALYEALQPRVLIPMHYRHGKYGYDPIATVDQFIALCPGELVRRYDGTVFTLTEETPRQVALLHFPE